MKIAPRKSSAVLIFLAFLHGVVLFAGFVAPYNPTRQDRDRPYAPPVTVHFSDRIGKFHLRPFVYAQRLREGSFDQYEEDRASRVPVRFFVPGSRIGFSA